MTNLNDRSLKFFKEDGKIMEKNKIYLKRKESELGNFFLLPNIHKELWYVPGRPLISNCDTDTERLSEFDNFREI